MITSQEKSRRGYETAVTIILCSGALCLILCTNVMNRGPAVLSHLLYVPIVLASLWWRRLGLWVAVCLGGVAIMSSALFSSADLVNNVLRASIFVLIASVIVTLSERTAGREQALRESEEKFRLLAERSLVGIGIIQEGVFRYVNKEMSDIIEYSVKEMMSWHREAWLETIYDRDRSRIAERMHREGTKGADRVATCEFRVVARGGTIKWVEMYSKTISLGGRDADFVIALDITNRKRAEEELKTHRTRLEGMVRMHTRDLKEAREQLVRRERLAMLGQLAGSVSHELRNPLGIISNAIYYLKMVHTDADDTTREYMDIIAAEVNNSEKIISDLLEFSHIGQGDKEEMPLTELVTRALERQTTPYNITVVTEISPDLQAPYVDAQQIVQVLINLISNACHAMPDGGRLTIEARGNHHGVRLSLSDTGSGIPPEDMDKIFEPLVTTRTRGIGLGLAVSRNLIENNGGTIAVTSEIGRGSVFTITLPVKAEEGVSVDVSGGSPDDQIPYRLPRDESSPGGEHRFGR